MTEERMNELIAASEARVLRAVIWAALDAQEATKHSCFERLPALAKSLEAAIQQAPEVELPTMAEQMDVWRYYEANTGFLGKIARAIVSGDYEIVRKVKP